MTNSEKQSWVTLFGLGIVLVILFSRMMSGGQITDFESGELLSIYISLIVTTVILIVAGMIGLRIAGAILFRESETDSGPEQDERDVLISARASRNEGIFYGIAINLLILQQLMAGYFTELTTRLPQITTAADWVFVLFTLVALASMVREISRLVYYRL